MNPATLSLLGLALGCAAPLALADTGPVNTPKNAFTTSSKSQPSAQRAGITGLDKAQRRADGAQVVKGVLAGQGVIPGQGTRVIQGKVSPGNSPGCVTDQGNVIFEGSAWLEIELGGTTACSGYDQYTVNLSLTLNSPTLNVNLYNGFVPAAGQRFDILNWGTLSGAFATINLPPLPSGLSWDTSQLHTTGELVVQGPPLLDDGDVPLPAWALVMLGAGLAGGMLRRR